MDNDAACATLIRKVLRLEVMLCERLRERRQENIDQVEEQKAEEKAQRQAELAQIESVQYWTVQVHTFQKSDQLAQGEVNFRLKVQER